MTIILTSTSCCSMLTSSKSTSILRYWCSMYLHALHFSDVVLGSSNNNAVVSDDSINMFFLSLECLMFCSFLTCHLYHLNDIFRTFYLSKIRHWCSSSELASVHFFVATNLVGITVTIVIILILLTSKMMETNILRSEVQIGRIMHVVQRLAYYRAAYKKVECIVFYLNICSIAWLFLCIPPR